MIVPAAVYGLIRYHSVWYAVNLLAAGGFVSWAGESNAFLAQFHIEGFARGHGHPCSRLGPHRPALRSHVADVSLEADPHRWIHRTLSVDGNSIPRLASSVPFSTRVSTGPGSSSRRLPSAWSAALS